MGEGSKIEKTLKFLRSRYFKDIFNQAGLVILAQMIPVGFSPLLSRIYDENAMAEITGLIALSGLMLVFSTFKLENAIITEEHDQSAWQLLLLCAFFALGFTIFTVLLVTFSEEIILTSFKIEGVIRYLPPYILFFSLLNALNSWFVRIKRFKIKAYSKIIENSSYILFAVGFYFLAGENEYGLALGKMLGIAVALLVLVNIAKLRFRTYSWSSYKRLLSKHREYPLYYTPSSFVNVMGLHMLVIFIGTYFTKEQLGFFGLANMVMLLPISFITQSVGSIFFQKTSEHINKGERNLLKKVFLPNCGHVGGHCYPGIFGTVFWERISFPLNFWSQLGSYRENCQSVGSGVLISNVCWSNQHYFNSHQKDQIKCNLAIRKILDHAALFVELDLYF